MATVGTYAEYDEYLAILADAQRYKLRLNAHKGFLGDVSPDILLTRLREEVDELAEAMSRGSAFDMILESSDICNFALGVIISVIHQRRKRDARERSAGDGLCEALERATARA